MFVIVSVLVLLFFLLTTWTTVSAVIVSVMVLPVQVMEPRGPIFRVQSDGQPVIPAAFGIVILVEFAIVAISINTSYCFEMIIATYSDTGRWLLCLKV